MEPELEDVLRQMRDARAFMPGTLPQSGFGFPALATPAAAQPAASAPEIDAGNIPPPDMQMAVIEQIKSMLASKDKATRDGAQAYLDAHGRNLLAVGLNAATRYGIGVPGQRWGQGTVDYLMTQTPGTPPGEYLNRYSPEEIDFAKRLAQGVLFGASA